ncbi:MAG: BTAD domain-containing putative transcriptional regulator, partial [Actinomycetota bacterium]
MTITIDVFGPMSVHLEDGQAAPLQPKLQHLLGLLVAAEGQWVSLDAIIDDYWRPDALPASPRAAVQTAMSRLRTRLGDASHEIVQSTDVAYRVDRNRVDVDLWTWSSTIHEAEQGRPSRALARYRHANSIWSGAPFASVDTSPRLDDLSLRLQLTRARAARDEARHLLDAGEPAEALARLDDQLTGDLETEGPVILGMLAMAALGQVTSALGLAGRFRTELRERHGLSPSSDFVTAERELLERPPDDGRAAARRRPRPRSGRSWRTETVDLTAAAVLEAIDTSRTRVWHIVAPHGFGLTTLLRDVGERIGDERPDVGVALIRGRHADRSNPFALLASRDRDEEHGPIAEPLHAVERLVADVGDAARVIIIDDADQLDARARSVLSTLHALEPEVRLVVLAGAHSADEASVRRLPLPGELQIRLVELTEQEVAGVVERAGLASSRGEREDVARRIHRWGRGDPTSLVEALDAIRRDGPSAALPIPTPRRSAIEQAIAALDDHDAEFLRRVAVVGRSVDPIALSHVCETDVHVVIDVLDRAVDCRLLSPSPRPGEYEFSDDASRAALSERLSAGAVRRLHQRAGDWFERVGRFAQAAEHHLAAFPVEAGPDLRRLMRAAADECLERREDLRAAHWLGELAGFEPDGPERFAAQLEQCRALERAGRHDRADEILASLSDTVEATGDWDLVADVALAGAGLSSRIGGSDARRMRLERALRCLPDDHGGRSEVVAELALEHLEATRSFGPALTNQLAEVASD